MFFVRARSKPIIIVFSCKRPNSAKPFREPTIYVAYPKQTSRSLRSSWNSVRDDSSRTKRVKRNDIRLYNTNKLRTGDENVGIEPKVLNRPGSRVCGRGGENGDRV